MSFKVKSPKVEAPPTPPVQSVAPVTQPTTDRSRRLSSGGRQSSFLGGLARAALPQARGSLTGSWGT
ncbi:hypothetical protein [Phenylobacterium sp. SCN 70-31]|uniref:hypothetical protein n=1 Tax=Phenylobacterium sp. SCN 70-31 TaxID=1660129 RepID=UPI00086E03A3|nr:hypothetical protein [Phenylobacterium sp. SCN 70-31]ODT88116.1 MAG: hypothetical protein ABS78_09500 [Phenylobacterium sp. SCN 70-31]